MTVVAIPSSPICQTGSCMLDSHRAAHVLAKLQLLCFHYKNGRICSSCLCLDQTTSWLFILKSRYWIQRWHVFNPIRIACQGYTPKKFSSFQAHLVLTHPFQYAQYFFLCCPPCEFLLEPYTSEKFKLLYLAWLEERFTNIIPLWIKDS